MFSINDYNKSMINQQLTFLSPRLIQCLIVLCNTDGFMTVHDLAEKVKTSKRTLFRELKDINTILKSYPVKVITRPKYGIKLECETEEKLHFKSLLLQISANQNNLSKEDRQTVLLAEILKNKSLQKLIVYANEFSVSEATISNDIDGLEPILNNYGLSLVRKPGSNLSIEGSEEAIRKAIRDFVYQHMEEEKLVRLLNQQMPWDIEDYFKNQGPDSILNVLNKEILWQVIAILKENDSTWIHRLAQNSYIGLILHLTIAIERMVKQDPITIDPSLLEQLRKDPMFEKAKELAEYFEDEFDLVFPTEEIAYISMHLKGARLLHIDVIDPIEEEGAIQTVELQRLVNQLIDQFEKVSRVKVKNDEILVHGLMTHLRPALTRLHYNLEIRNPLLNQIKTQYTSVYNQSSEACKNTLDKRISSLNENEIGFIAMHFGAALERIKQNEPNRPVKLAVLCASGIGISSLLASRIKRSLKDSIVVIPRSHLDLQQIKNENFDLIVSTMEIEDIGLPYVIVNPLLSDTDLERIHQAVNSITSTPELSEPTNEINLYQSLHASAILSESILNLVDQIEVIQLSSDITRKGIIEKVSHYLGHDSESRKQIQKDILQRESIGSVVMDEENFALYHAQTNAVRLPRMLVFRPNKEVFNAYDSKTVHLIVALLIPENSFRELNYWMSHLSSALIEDDAYRLAIFSEDKTVIQKEVLRILKGPIKDWYRKVGG